MNDNTSTSFARCLDTIEEADCAEGSLNFEALNRAEQLVDTDRLPPQLWHRFLDLFSRVELVSGLATPDEKARWFAICLAAIQRSRYHLGIMLRQRADRHPQRPLLLTPNESWSYQQAVQRIDAIAAALMELTRPYAPRVALVSDNRVDGALCDLACLSHGLLVTPLNPRFPVDTLQWILERLQINVIVVGGRQHRAVVEGARRRLEQPMRIVALDEGAADAETPVLARVAAAAPVSDRRLPEPCLDGQATVMFTSGSTGRPKGVVFDHLNLMSKRFARGAALPEVGRDEKLLCYLPLYHTFGRFLELLGTVYWGGSYVFAGDSSTKSYLDDLRRVQPTGMVSVPRRWEDLWRECGGDEPERRNEECFRQVVGDRLRWGISAAGHLDAEIFRFFQRRGVDLVSGFGMTEATGGITMTRPGAYEDNTVGVPLPGVETRLSEEGELQIRGPYIARYLDDDASAREQGWLRTGDVFERLPSGNLRLVDRLKDMYKNRAGRSIAPRKVEQLFDGVPGVERVFLVGDKRDDNVLLVVPDRTDPVIREAAEADAIHRYFARIIATANSHLAPFERVADFALVERDFSLDLGELTAKGSYRRSAIEKNFDETITELYARRDRGLRLGELGLRLPHRALHQAGLLESDLTMGEHGLEIGTTSARLELRWLGGARVRVGDLEYELDGAILDLDLMCSQPRLWLGNAQLAAFLPCRADWELPIAPFGGRVFLPGSDPSPRPANGTAPAAAGRRLTEAHELTARAMLGTDATASQAAAELGGLLPRLDRHLASAVRRRLESLADHPQFAVRSMAYAVLLTAEPTTDHERFLPTFLLSGRSFLDAATIQRLADAPFTSVQMESLRRRMLRYRRTIKWPCSPVVRRSIEGILELVADHAVTHPADYATVRAELACWALHDEDPDLAASAELMLEDLWKRLTQHGRCGGPSLTQVEMQLEAGISPEVGERLNHLLRDTDFLYESLSCAFPSAAHKPVTVNPPGIWVTPIFVLPDHRLFRLSLNTVEGEHYDLLLSLRRDLDVRTASRTVLWMAAIGGHVEGGALLPALGCSRPELGALSVAFADELSVAERVRQMSSRGAPDEVLPLAHRWRVLWVRAMAAFFKAWAASEKRLVPGLVDPANVCVPEPEIREGERLLSLAGWRSFRDPVDLVRPLVHSFYHRIAHHYPRVASLLRPEWILEACCEALGDDDGGEFLAQLAVSLEGAEAGLRGMLLPTLESFRGLLDHGRRRPLALDCAVERYRVWCGGAHGASATARRRTVRDLDRAHRLWRYGDHVRLDLYRRTIFGELEDPAATALDELIENLRADPAAGAVRSPKLWELMVSLGDEDRAVVQEMLFQGWQPELDVQAARPMAEGETRVALRTVIRDRNGHRYTLRDATAALEVGRLYRLFAAAGFPLARSPQDRFLAMFDGDDEMVGGAIWTEGSAETAAIEGVVCVPSLRGLGLTGAIIEDLCGRLSALGVRVVTTHLALSRVYELHGFRPDPYWGGLARHLSGGSEAESAPEVGDPTAAATTPADN